MQKRLKKLGWVVLSALFICIIALSRSLPVGAAPSLQYTDFPTPTPGTDGRILYIVQPNDTLWRISAVAGISLEELRSLNNLGPEDIIIEGQILLIGLGGPAAAPTPLPGQTAVPLPTATSGEPEEKATVIICVMLYNDINGDAIRQTSEIAIPGGEVSVTERTGLASKSQSTDLLDPDYDLACFKDLPEGNYTVSVAAPEGYNNTTVQSVTFDLSGGDTSFLNFGAQVSAITGGGGSANNPAQNGGRSPLLGILGGAVLIAGIGLAVYSWVSSRQSED
ncbi:MAG: LysM peptidoglycan-binding domain-containing protein [Anaerolineae bacterium]|nr:LysM peptidoglycan-binding domain-containing protein [Anaerolineae bacterium]